MSKQEINKEAGPPIFSTWKQLYTFVLVAHAFIIALFYWFSVANS